jgi:hypothetical protein
VELLKLNRKTRRMTRFFMVFKKAYVIIKSMNPSNDNSVGIFSQGGDSFVLTGNGKTGKNKKIWLLGGLALIAVAVVVVLVIFGMKGGKTALTTKQALNAYSNYLLYGKDSQDDIAIKHRWSNDYYLSKMEEKDQNYFAELKTKLDVFKQLFENKYKEHVFPEEDEYDRILNLVATCNNYIDAVGQLLSNGIGLEDDADYSVFKDSTNPVLAGLNEYETKLKEAIKANNVEQQNIAKSDLNYSKSSLRNSLMSTSEWIYKDCHEGGVNE